MAYLKKAKSGKNNRNSEIKRKQRQAVYQTKEWKELRLSHYQKNPLCELCKQNGIIKEGSDIHHIISPFKFNGQKAHYWAFNPKNLVTLCKECHSYIHSNHLEESLYNALQCNDSTKDSSPFGFRLSRDGATNLTNYGREKITGKNEESISRDY